MATIESVRSTRYLKFIEGTALLYSFIAAAFTLFNAFIIVSASVTGGGNAISLPVSANGASVAPELSVGLGDAHFTMVEFTENGLSTGAALLYFAPRVLVPLLHAIVAASVARFALGARKERPFAASLAQSITTIALSVAIVGSLSQLFHNYGISLARHELLAGTDLASGWLTPPSFDWTPILAGLGLLAIVSVLRVGERMQRDTEGLV